MPHFKSFFLGLKRFQNNKHRVTCTQLISKLTFYQVFFCLDFKDLEQQTQNYMYIELICRMTLLLGPPGSGKTSLFRDLFLAYIHVFFSSTIQFHFLSFQLKFVNHYLFIVLFFKDFAWLSIKVHDHHYHHQDVQILNNFSLLIKEVDK